MVVAFNSFRLMGVVAGIRPELASLPTKMVPCLNTMPDGCSRLKGEPPWENPMNDPTCLITWPCGSRATTVIFCPEATHRLSASSKSMLSGPTMMPLHGATNVENSPAWHCVSQLVNVSLKIPPSLMLSMNNAVPARLKAMPFTPNSGNPPTTISSAVLGSVRGSGWETGVEPQALGVWEGELPPGGGKN